MIMAWKPQKSMKSLKKLLPREFLTFELSISTIKNICVPQGRVHFLLIKRKWTLIYERKISNFWNKKCYIITPEKDLKSFSFRAKKKFLISWLSTSYWKSKFFLSHFKWLSQKKIKIRKYIFQENAKKL